MGLTAVFGITNGGLNLMVNLFLLFLFVFWIALIYWTYTDARRRIEDPMLVGCATAASVFPYMGTVVYLLVRPPEFLEDMRERDLEIAAAEARLHSLEVLACPYCDTEVERSFLRCPSCLRRLKEPCTSCGKALDPRWKLCPYCEAEIGEAAPPERPRERRPAPAAQPTTGQRQSQPATGQYQAQPAAGQRQAQPAAGQRQAQPAAGQRQARPPAGSREQYEREQHEREQAQQRQQAARRAAGQRPAAPREPRAGDGSTRDQPAAPGRRPRPSTSG